MTVLWLKWLHVLSSTILFGTGVGIAYFFVRANRTGDPRIIAGVAREVVRADALFTAVAVVVQPATGVALALHAGWPLAAPWIATSLVLYGVVVACWLPVVWLQLRMRDLASQAATSDAPLPLAYRRLYRAWFALGVPALAGMLVIFWLMIAKPGGG